MTNNPEKALSRKAQGEETRAVLIDVGARLFAQNGFHGVSMRTLAAEAGVNLATVGYHFGGKQGLYEAIMDAIIEVRDDFFPTAEQVRERFADLKTPEEKGEGVSWYVDALTRGILGMKKHIWPSFLLSRELAQPTQSYPKLEKEFFDPSFESLMALVKSVLPEDTDEEEYVITAHTIIGTLTKFLEGHDIICKRMEWESYEGHGLEKIITVVCKRIRGSLGLPMENA
ncbi:CerR family C-terminal domain-containing protein [Pseudodesulfovibrio sp. zrk46]|uniref:CerR family C-terminal domain-containing protein n=1 Tax=Pseudodesulfovibrio sp. zrk46 TaxID=2725288 RepID=UPI0014497E91|nr:CerR family C-terminal domain-containing protein [Pseudodesulfovibrio sp. zrk46]QJB57119.1 CerR family C-terminal domain-containing protein [Pseudodesulfovibrio sp. zrk46]